MSVTISGDTGLAGAATGALNGSLGATTPSTVVATTISGTDLTTTGNTILGNASTDTLNVGNGGLIKDASGNVGVGVTPSAWHSGYRAMQFALAGALWGNKTGTDIYLSSNYIYNPSGANKYQNNGYANYYAQANGSHAWFNAPSGTAGDTITFTQAMTLDASGNLLVGKTVAASGVKGHYFDPDGTWRTSTNGTGASNHAVFVNAADTTPAAVGVISTSGSTTTYATSSDYRLKENVQPMIGALSVVQALKPVTYSWKVDGSDGQGFIAHELQEVVPDAVVGEKDAVNEDGSIKAQAIDTSFLVATLTAAIQEQQALITSLTARLEVLEAK